MKDVHDTLEPDPKKPKQRHKRNKMAAAAPVPRPLELDPKYDDYDFPTTAAVPLSGHAGYLTAEQQAQVSQLRLMLESEGYTKRLDTLTLVRLAPE